MAETVEIYIAPNGATFEVKEAAPSNDQLNKRLKSGIYRFEDSELYKRCSKCLDYWPADTEFFFSVKEGDGLHCQCKACYHEGRYPNGRSVKADQLQGVAE